MCWQDSVKKLIMGFFYVGILLFLNSLVGFDKTVIVAIAMVLAKIDTGLEGGEKHGKV